MDDFLREIYVKVYRSWILGQKSEQYNIKEVDEKTIVLDGVGAIGKVVFQGNVIELSVTNKKNDHIDFYLHFQMQTLGHASSLFNELIDAMATAENTKIVQVLLSCTSGLTTGFFAQELNQAATTLCMDYHFEAVPYNELTAVGRNCDIILLAPQIGYQQPKVQSIFHQIPVVTVPSQVFAKYDVRGALKLVGDSLLAQEVVDIPKALQLSVDYDEDILSIGIFKTTRSTRILYRVYKHSSVLEHGQIIKQKLCIDDLDDLIDFMLVSYPHLKKVGIATPGIIDQGHLTLEKDQLFNVDIIAHFKEKYPYMNIHLDKASEAIAMTLYELQDYKSLSFLYLPKSSYVAGMGNINEGKIMNGHMDVSGDLHQLPFIYEKDPREQILSEEGCLDIVAKHFLLSIMTFSPEVLAFYCSNVVNVEDVVKKLEDYVPRHYIPKIKKLDNIEEYLLFGEMLKCIAQEKQSA